MANITKAISFKNATICKADMTITEIGKDFEKVYSLENVLTEWDGVEGLAISIKLSDEIPEDGE